MENRIKECQLDLFADRTSARTMRANQLRLWFASMAYSAALQRCALLPFTQTNLAPGATCAKIRRMLSGSSRRVHRRAPHHDPHSVVGLPLTG